MVKSAALLLGINYVDTPDAHLKGCVNDVENMRAFLIVRLGFSPDTVRVYSDEDPNTRDRCTAVGIVRSIQELAIKSWKDNLDQVWIHYSGHGSQILDASSDEADKKDECLVPSDFRKGGGIITDDVILKLLNYFNPKTKVFTMFDCCHSGSIADLRYRFDTATAGTTGTTTVDENPKSKCTPRVVSISGCRDDQTSADAWNVMNENKFSGALTSSLLLSFTDDCTSDLFKLVQNLRLALSARGFAQYPLLYASYDLKSDPCLLVKQ